MELNKIRNMKFQYFVLKLYSSFYKRIHSWGLLFLLLLLYSSSVGLRSPVLLMLFGRLGLMTIHVFSGFGLILVFIIIAYNYLQGSVFVKKNPPGKSRFMITHQQLIDKSGSRRIVDMLFYIMLMVVCCLGFIYYFLKEFAIYNSLIYQSTASLLHAVAGWFFLSMVFLKYYLTLIQWFREFYNYLRGF